MKAPRGRRAQVERHALFDESLGSVVKRMVVDEGKKFLKELPGKALAEPSHEFVQAQVAETSISPDVGTAAPASVQTQPAVAPGPARGSVAQGPRQFDPADRT